MWTYTTTNFSTFLLCSLLLLAYSMECAQADYQVITNEFPTGYDSNSKEATKTAPLRVVTFNIWLSGAKVSNGLVKIAKQISELNPDIVALQVMTEWASWLAGTGIFDKDKRRYAWDAVNTMDALTWWSAFFSETLLSKIVKMLHNVPISAAPTERNWSIRGGIHTKLRNRMKVNTASQVTYIKHNLLLEYKSCFKPTRVEQALGEMGLEAEEIDLIEDEFDEVESDSVISNLTKLLGKPWTGVGHTGRNYTDTGILTRHKILQDQLVEVSRGNGVPIVVDAQGVSFTVNFFSMHLSYTSYGPYAAQNKMVTKAEQIYKGEKTADGKGRVSNIQELLDNPKFQAFSLNAEKKGHPLVVAADFNCPSHQDWTEETKHLHGDWVFEWPVTKLLTGIGMVDSFRQLHPNVSEVPGYTWSTVRKWSGSEWDYSIPEPQDRLDFIFYKGSQNNIKPVKSFTYSGNAADPLKAIPNQYENNYPSDHFIVLTDFEVSVEKQDE